MKIKLTTEELKYFISNFRGKDVCATVINVEQPGMSRRIKFLSLDNKMKILKIDYYIAGLLGYSYDYYEGVLVKDIDIINANINRNSYNRYRDMIFHVLTEINYAVAKIDNVSIENDFLYTNYFFNAENYYYF
jgi:hypothetical protein